jgi:hypothetical protein
MSETWYHLVDGQTVGPLLFSDLQQMAAAGTLKPADRISTNGEAWQPASDVTGLLFAPPPLPPPFPPSTTSAPTAQNLSYQAPYASGPPISARVVELFGQTARWVRIMSVILFVSIGLMLVVGAIMLLMQLVHAGPSAEGPPGVLGLAYFVMSAFYIPPAIFLHRYAGAAKMFSRLRDDESLEKAVEAQKSFWKFVAVLALVIIGLYIVMIPVIVIITLLHR